MANVRPYKNVGGTITQVQDADTVIVGNGVTTAAGSLTISSAANSLILAAGLALSVAGGAGAIDFSGSSGAFKTPTGAVTLGPSNISVTGLMSASGGTGNINLPNNGTARFQIETVAVSANVTAANLGTLTAGPASNADALHTHSGIGSASSLVISGLTTTGVTAGLAGYISANNTVSKTDNAAIASSRFFGINIGTVGSMTVAGTVAVVDATTAGGSPSPGTPVWLAAAADDGATGAGKVTATAPSAIGSVIAEVGLVLDNSNYAGAKTIAILIQPKSVIQL